MITVYALLTGYILDLLIGDPEWLPHPIRTIGTMIARGEAGLRRLSCKSPRSQYICGAILTIIVVTVSFAFPYYLLKLSQHIHPFLPFCLEALMCYQILATRSLKTESMRVYERLAEGDLPGARQNLSRIVSRDTEHMQPSQIAKSTVETVAENTSDGVIAPMFFILIGGAPFGFLYKAINTLDSMIGYKNDRYLYFGRFAAKLDDAVNFVPARIAAYLMILATFLVAQIERIGYDPYDWKTAWIIYRRDRKNHTSPNSAHTEAVCAGALHIQLAGDNYYFGKRVEKPTIGDDTRQIQAEDIPRANTLLYATSILGLLFGIGIRLIVLRLY